MITNPPREVSHIVVEWRAKLHRTRQKPNQPIATTPPSPPPPPPESYLKTEGIGGKTPVERTMRRQGDQWWQFYRVSLYHTTVEFSSGAWQQTWFLLCTNCWDCFYPHWEESPLGPPCSCDIYLRKRVFNVLPCLTWSNFF